LIKNIKKTYNQQNKNIMACYDKHNKGTPHKIP